MEVSLAQGPRDFSAAGNRLTGLNNLAEYQALFEQYKLSAYKVTFMPRLQNISAQQYEGGVLTTTPAFRVPRFVIQKDAEGRIVPAGLYGPSTLNILMEGGGRIVRGDRTFSVYMKPKIVEQYGGGADRYVTPKYTDVGTTVGINVPHRGFHLMLFREGFDVANADMKWDVFITYYLRFKNAK